MIDVIIRVLGTIVLALYGLVFLWAMAKVFSIANDTRSMVVLLRRSLDQARDFELMNRVSKPREEDKEEPDVES